MPCHKSPSRILSHGALADIKRYQAMHAGVVRDMEQQRIKKERQLDFEMQRELEAEYRKVQNVSSSNNKQTATATGPG